MGTPCGLVVHRIGINGSTKVFVAPAKKVAYSQFSRYLCIFVIDCMACELANDLDRSIRVKNKLLMSQSTRCGAKKTNNPGIKM